jgi:exopolyphosphatase/guanosine-5'-triphosphate,3'-diphosphate pyrophosphatase
MRVGAIDIGSNSIRLLVADIPAGGAWSGPVEAVARAGEPCRLGRGLHEHGVVAEDMAERAAIVSTEFARRARSLGADHILAAATAAIRMAGNGAEVAARIGERAGVPVRILTGDEEAQLVYASVVLGLGGRARESQCIVFDLGGGSTEVVSGVGAQPGRWQSVPFGAVSLTERLLHEDPPSAATLDRARETIGSELMHACASFPARTPLLAGVGGTVTVLASMDRGLAEYDPALLEGWFIPAERALASIAALVSADASERRRLPVMGEGRADIVAAGCLVVEALLRRFEPPGLVCSTQGLRYGLARLAADPRIGGR